MIDPERFKQLIMAGESLEREFKSDRKQISDSKIYEEVVAMANTRGGVIFIGVEDDGTVTGAKPRHGASTIPSRLQSAIFNNTIPNINTKVCVASHTDGDILCVEVPLVPEPCSTASGKSLRRIVGPDGKPQTVPFYPRDQRSRRIDMGLLDFSDQPIDDSSFDDLDPLEFERLRQAISRLRGDRTLTELSNEEIAKALRLVVTKGNRLVPKIAGLLLVGRESALESFIPTHEVRFQVIGERGDVKVNELLRGPVLSVLEQVESRFSARNEEREVPVGLFRVPVPDYSEIGFREAVNNAVLHRDYSQHGSVYIQWFPDHMLLTNPGGFVEGITPDNILTHEPKPRNPRLAEAFRRIGLVEQTGRGVDKIYEGQLRYGRPAPDYRRSDSSGVRVVLHGGKPSLQFAAFVYEQERLQTPLTLDELMVLNALFLERRIDSVKAGRLIQKGTAYGRSVLERLNERGLVEARGEKRGREYHLAANLYKRLGGVAAYVRTRGFDRIQQQEMILNALHAEGRITRRKAADLCKISEPQAYYLLSKMRFDNYLELRGKGRGAYYTLKRRK